MLPKDYPYWWDTVSDRHYEPLPRSSTALNADVVIIGGGFTGLSAAITLGERGRSVICVDERQPGHGASSRNGGMIGGGHKVTLAHATRLYGRERALALQSEGLASYRFTRDLIEKHRIDCDFMECGRLRTAWTRAQYDAMARDLDTLRNECGVDAEMIPAQGMAAEINSPLYFGGMLYREHGGLNPRKFHDGLADRATHLGAQIFADTRVTGIKKAQGTFTISTDRGDIRCAHVIAATNGYTPGFLRHQARRIIPVPSFIITTSALGEDRVNALLPGNRMMVETRNRFCYYRRTPDSQRILLGARASLTEIPQRTATRRLQYLLGGIFPDLADIPVSHSWRGFTGFTFEHLPHVGIKDGIHFAMGYSGSGVAMAPYLGYKTALAVLGDREAESAFCHTHFDTRFFYRRRSWFLKPMNALYAYKDFVENRRASRDRTR